MLTGFGQDYILLHQANLRESNSETFPAPSPGFTVRLVQQRSGQLAPLPTASFEAELADILPEVGADMLVRTATQAETQQYARGEVIIRQGEAATTFYMITAGEVAIVKESGTAAPQVV
jgi:hypothetical protein